MVFRIADTVADIVALLELLEGIHEPQRTTKTVGWCTAAMLCLVVPAGLATAAFVVASDLMWIALFLFLLAAVSIALGIAFFLHSVSVFAVGPSGFSRSSPVPWGTWKVQSSELSAVDLQTSTSPPSLLLRKASGGIHSFPLWPTFLVKLETIYPWLASLNVPVVVPQWIGRLAYVCLAIVVLWCATAFYWIYREGLWLW